MSVLEIKKYPDPILKKRAEKIREITPQIKKLARDMAETMIKNEGAGLAGPQLGVLKRIITVQTGKGPVVCINPKIIKKSKEKEVMEEGCLSLPGIWLNIKRAKTVEVEFIDLNGKKEILTAEGFLARVFQHEINHLDGVLIVDKIGFLKKLKIRKGLMLANSAKKNV